MQVQSDSGTLAPYVPRALLARLARATIEVLTETVPVTWCSPTELESSRRHRPLLQRVCGIALARLDRNDEAAEQLRISLASGQEAGADYEVAATIDVLDALGLAGPDMRRDRDEIMGRLRIERLPVPAP